ncbi:MAG TPA: PaaI family thioesterase [Methylibium sp.]|nr:PaaI family thioesterase [Methylibium sp.]
MDFPLRIPFIEELGLELLGLGDGESELALTLAERHANSFGVAHGGVTMTLLDVAMAHAARSVNRHRRDFGPGVVTIEMKTSFIRPGLGRLTARGRLLSRTATLAFCEASVYADDAALCAHATGTFKYLRALPTGTRALRPLKAGPGSD